MSRALPGQCQGDVAAIAEHEPGERRATTRDAEAGRDERPRPAQTVRAAGRPCASVPADRVACAFGFSAYGPRRRRRPVRSDRVGAERPDAVAGPQSVKPAPCGDGVSAESPTTRLPDNADGPTGTAQGRLVCRRGDVRSGLGDAGRPLRGPTRAVSRPMTKLAPPKWGGSLLSEPHAAGRRTH